MVSISMTSAPVRKRNKMDKYYDPWGDRLPVWKRYESDTTFRYLVDACESMLDHAQVTPSELREAVMYAAIRTEWRTLRKNLIYPSDWGIEAEVVRGTLERMKESE